MTGPLPDEIDVLRNVSGRLDGAGIPFMLTGSLAMNYYATPRMTRDINVVAELEQPNALESSAYSRAITTFRRRRLQTPCGTARRLTSLSRRA